MKHGILLHGGALDLMKARFPDAPSPWIDLSTGINPWPYKLTGDSRHTAQHLPTAEEFKRCADALASSVGANGHDLLLSPGSELLIRLLPTILFARSVCVTACSYGDHVSAWRSAGVNVTESLEPLSQLDQCDVLVICNPNNPDGRRWPAAELVAAKERLSAKGGWLIVDEAYMDLYPQESMLCKTSMEGLIVLRSFGKFYGLAGLRLGAIFAPAPVLRAMGERLGVWPVAGPTLEIGTNAYSDTQWQADTRRRVAAAREELDQVFAQRGLEVVGGTDLFRLVRTESAETWWTGLAEHGIYARRFAWSNYNLRFALPATDDELTRLDTTLKEISLSV